MTALSIFRPEETARWNDVLRQLAQHDFYYLPEYSALAEEMEQGNARLFVYTQGPHVIAMPLLLRPIEAVPGLGRGGAGLWDATSVYGYAGPVGSRAALPLTVVKNFHAALRVALQDWHVVSVFSRLHPLIPQRELLVGLGECARLGETVSIDLTSPVDQQFALYRPNHKRGIRKLRRLGVTAVNDAKRASLSEFIGMYHETMRRVNAHSDYLFPPLYFRELVAKGGPRIQLFVCQLRGEIICGGLFTLLDGIVQYHLGATRTEFLKLAPMKLLFETVRLWANEQGAKAFHLGGGVGTQEDSLFHFKAGFSNRRHQFATWRWILLADIYKDLCHEKILWYKSNAQSPPPDGYFPAYRAATR